VNGFHVGSLVVATVVITVAVIFNKLINKRQLTKNGWSDIDVQLKRRADLIPSLVDVVKGYVTHERTLFEEITQKRSAAMAAGNDPAARGAAESAFSRPVSKLVAVAEEYPDLKASGQFLSLQRQLADTEDKIEMARRFYNGAVRELNILIESVPFNLVASAFGFKKCDYFEVGADSRVAPVISVEQ